MKETLGQERSGSSVDCEFRVGELLLLHDCLLVAALSSGFPLAELQRDVRGCLLWRVKWILAVPDLRLVNENQCLDLLMDGHLQNLTFCPSLRVFLPVKLGSLLAQTQVFIHVEFKSNASVLGELYVNFELAEITYFVICQGSSCCRVCSLVIGELKGVMVQVQPNVFMCTYIGRMQSRKEKGVFSFHCQGNVTCFSGQE